MKVLPIEEGTPIPEVMPRNNKYDFHKMSVGQHFTIKDCEPGDELLMRVAACNYGRRNNKKFVTRKIEIPPNDFMVKIWRKE